MRQKTVPGKQPAEDMIRDIRRATRRDFSAEEFKRETAAPNQLLRTDFTYLKITGWGWYYLSTVLDDYSRYIVACKLCVTMKAQDVTDTLDLALAKSGLDQVNVGHRPRLLSDNAPLASQVISPNGSTTRKSSISVMHLIILRHRVRSTLASDAEESHSSQ